LNPVPVPSVGLFCPLTIDHGSRSCHYELVDATSSDAHSREDRLLTRKRVGPGDPEGFVEFGSAEEMREWLSKEQLHFERRLAAPLQEGSGLACEVQEALEELLLRYGWIAGQLRPLDEVSWLGGLIPRRPKSTWSQINEPRGEAHRGGQDAVSGRERGQGGEQGRQVGEGVQPAQRREAAP
jgi:hypothetical protein